MLNNVNVTETQTKSKGLTTTARGYDQVPVADLVGIFFLDNFKECFMKTREVLHFVHP